MKKLLIVALSAAVLLAMLGYLVSVKTQTGSKSAAISPTPVLKPVVKLGYLPKSSLRILVAVADKKGFFKKNNVDVKIYGVENAIATSLVSKQTNVVLDLPSTLLLARANGSDIVEIGEVTNDYPFLLISYKNPSFVKTIAIPRIGGEPHLRALEILKKLNIDSSKVTFQASGSGPASAELLKKREVDAAMLSTFDWSVLKTQTFASDVPKILFDTSKEKDLRNPNIIVVNAEFLKKNKKIMENFSKALIEANNYIKSSKDEELVSTLSAFSQIEDKRALETVKNYKSTLEGWKFKPDLERTIALANTLKEFNDKKFNPATFISLDIFSALEKSGFIKN